MLHVSKNSSIPASADPRIQKTSRQRLTPFFSSLFFLILVGFLGACSDGDNSTGTEETSSSSSEELSSSSISNRYEIFYIDTIAPGDTLNIARIDSLSRQNYYLGEFPKGTRIEISLQGDSAQAEFSIIKESGESLLPVWPEGSVWLDYMTPGQGEPRTNFTITRDSSYWYFLEADLSAATDSSEFKIVVHADTARYTLISDTLKLDTGDASVEAATLLGAGGSQYQICFNGEAGTSINLEAEGDPLELLNVKNAADSTIFSGTSSLRKRLLPVQSQNYCFEFTTPVASYLNGPWAFMNASVQITELIQGEFFSKPDSITALADTLKISRPQNPVAQYDVLYEHYVYLGDFSSGDSLHIWYGTRGVAGNSRSLKLLNSSGSEVLGLSRIFSMNWAGQSPNTISIPADGKYYLWFLSEGGYFADTTESVSMGVMIQQPGVSESLDLLADTLRMTIGDTLSLDTLSYALLPESLNQNVQWFIPRADRGIVNDNSGALESTNMIHTDWITALSAGTTILRVKSIADPAAVDSTVIVIE